MLKLINIKCCLFAILASLFLTALSPIHSRADNPPQDPTFIQSSDSGILAVQSSRQGLIAAINFIDQHPELFPQVKLEKGKLLDREERLIVWQVWQSFLDNIIFCDSIGRRYSQIYEQAESKKNKATPFFITYASFLSQYRFAMDFINRIEKNPTMHVMLNEPVPELGLDKNTYSLLKYRFLNVIRGAEFARLNVLYKYYGSYGDQKLKTKMDEDISAIWLAGKGKGPTMTAINAAKIVSDLGFTAWFPAQKGISKLMGHIKVWRPDETLITQSQIKEMKEVLLPGDILLERREWYATNAGIPGYWPHAALYIGGPKERADFFDKPLAAWIKSQGSEDGRFESLLQSMYPNKYALSITPQEKHLPRVVEAIEKGVSFTTLEHSAAADSLVVLRPKLPKKSIAQAIIRAFHYSGRPYDFNFDFQTDSQLVCSELIYKAYEPTSETEGLTLPTKDILGRKITSPNDIAQLFDKEYNSEQQQLAFVTFLDGHESKKQALKEGVETFRTSWQRPKWHIWLQDLKDLSKEIN